MAEPVRLHHIPFHLAVRVLGGGFALFTVVAAVAVSVEQAARQPLALTVLALPFLVVLIFRATLWRTRAVWATEDHLEVGSGQRARRVPYRDIISIGNPGWAYPDKLFAPLELEVRGGPPVLFFPAEGARALLDARVAGARSVGG